MRSFRVAFVAALVSSLGVTCGPRLGAIGESCARTDDCAEPLRCVGFVCVPPNGGGAGGSGGTGGSVGGAGGSGGTGNQGGGATGGTGGTGNQGGTGGTGNQGGGGFGGGIGPHLSLGACDDCTDLACAAELEACGAECLAVETCLETVCRHLTEIGAPDEGQCQVYCQNLHLAGKQAHLDLVNCAVNEWASCPCAGFPADADACAAAMLAGECAAENAACNGSVDCSVYRDCVGACGSSADCVACSTSPAGQAGRDLFEAVQSCVARECLIENWSL